MPYEYRIRLSMVQNEKKKIFKRKQEEEDEKNEKYVQARIVETKLFGVHHLRIPFFCNLFKPGITITTSIVITCSSDVCLNDHAKWPHFLVTRELSNPIQLLSAAVTGSETFHFFYFFFFFVVSFLFCKVT